MGRMSWLDLKLALRMLIKYPGLTLVGGLAIAVTIAISAAAFETTRDFTYPTLPLDEGDRIVALENWNVSTNAPERRSLHDFIAWRDHLKSVEDIGAYSTQERNLLTSDGRVEPVNVAEISPAGFRVARVPPLLGRPLAAEDERDGAPPVAVIGYVVWQTRFGGDPNIVGQLVTLGAAAHTVVGVMPEGFAFPVSHRLWIPLRVERAGAQPLHGPTIRVFARLVPGVSLERAQAELGTLGTRAAVDQPETHADLRPRVLPYAESFVDPEMVGGAYTFQLFLLIALIVCCSNVATLVFARAASREGEIAVRTALGASRTRIVAQLFVEALALTSVAAIVGLIAARIGVGWAMDLAWSTSPNRRPFWWDNTFAPATMIYAAALTVGCAVVCGVVPALKVTRGRAQLGLHEVGGRGSSLRFGSVWTIVIAAQVALSVVFLPRAIADGWHAFQVHAAGRELASARVLSARLELEAESFGATYQEIERRLASEPEIVGVTFADRLPGMDHPRRRIEVSDAASSAGASRVRIASVDVDFFETLNAPMVAGRAFHAGDVAGQRVVIVNESFVQQILGGRNAIGRRVRYADAVEDARSAVPREPEPWHEIVGVVPDLGMNILKPTDAAGLYHPLAVGTVHPVRMAVGLRRDPASFASRLREVLVAVDPTMRVYNVLPLDEIGRTEQLGYRVFAAVQAFIASVVVLLSMVGIYSLMSFTVSRRTREIGIRTALGAHPSRIVTAIFSRALAQVGLGAIAGAAILVVAGAEAAKDLGLLIAVATLMMAAGLVACGVPAVRALRIQPTDALRDAG